MIGEIYDETDRDVQAVVREPDGAMLLVGDFPIHDPPDIGVHVEHLEDGDYTTLAGLVLARLGHIPTAPGEGVNLGRYTADVVEVTGHAITRVRLRPHTQPEPPRQGDSRP